MGGCSSTVHPGYNGRLCLLMCIYRLLDRLMRVLHLMAGWPHCRSVKFNTLVSDARISDRKYFFFSTLYENITN